MVPSALDRLNTSTATKTSFQLHSQNSKLSSKKTLGIFKLSLTISRVSLEKTPSINWRRLEISHHTSSISNLS